MSICYKFQKNGWVFTKSNNLSFFTLNRFKVSIEEASETYRIKIFYIKSGVFLILSDLTVSKDLTYENFIENYFKQSANNCNIIEEIKKEIITFCCK